MYTYHHLARADTILFKRLLKVFGEAFNEHDTYQRAVPSDAYLTSLLSKSHFIVLVAMMGEVVVGGIAAYELEKFEQERREIYIYDLAVTEAFRRQGIATELICQLRLIAKIRGAYVIYVQTDKGDLPALRLYESLGTSQEVLHFDIEV